MANTMYLITVACSVGTFYSKQTRTCESCPEGEYQDQEGQTSCLTCPSGVHVSGTRGAKNVSECGGELVSMFISIFRQTDRYIYSTNML